VDRFSVSLRGTQNEIRLDISDTGAGFDLEKVQGKKGWG